MPRRQLRFLGQQEPEEAVRRQREQVAQLADRRENRTADDIDRHAPLVSGEIEFHGLSIAREIADAEDGLRRLAVDFPQVSENLTVAGIKETQRASPESAEILSHREHPAHPVEQRMLVEFLRLDIQRLEAVERIHDRRQHKRCRINA